MSQARIIDGKAAAARLRDRLRERSERFKGRHGRPPGLRVIIVGDHPASRAYVRTKERMAEQAGIDGDLVELPEATSEVSLLREIEALNVAPEVDGILVQLPLPGGIDPVRVIEAISPAKDVDGFHPTNVGRLFSGRGRVYDDLLVPCTPLGCLILLQETLGEAGLRGLEAVVVGRSNIVGKPMVALLLGADCTVTIGHSRSRDLPALCRRAEVLVAAVGRPEMVRGDWLRSGATVIDVGINRVQEEDGKGRLVGDVAFAEAREVAGAVTPVPGGVGPMTVACLLRNTLIAAEARAGTA